MYLFIYETVTFWSIWFKPLIYINIRVVKTLLTEIQLYFRTLPTFRSIFIISRPVPVMANSVNLWWRCSLKALCPVFSCAATVAGSTEKDPYTGLWEICHLLISTTDDPIFIGQGATLAVNHPFFKEGAGRERWEGESADASLIFVRTLTGIVCNLTPRINSYFYLLHQPVLTIEVWLVGKQWSFNATFFVCNVIYIIPLNNIYIYMYAFSRRFYPKRLRLYIYCQYVCSLGTFCPANTIIYHWAIGTLCVVIVNNLCAIFKKKKKRIGTMSCLYFIHAFFPCF